jgi:hypothetical protein
MKPRTSMWIIYSQIVGILTVTFPILMTAAPASAQQNIVHPIAQPRRPDADSMSQINQTRPHTPDGISSGKVTLSVGSPGVSLLNSSKLLSGVAILDTGTAPASKVKVTSITLSRGKLTFPHLPLHLGSIPVNGEALLRANFTGSFIAGGQYTLRFLGTYTVGSTPHRFALKQLLTVPPASPGSASVTTTEVVSHFVSGGKFPHQSLHFDREVNSSGWTVPTGPHVVGKPTQVGTRARKAPLVSNGHAMSAPPDVVFDVNNGLGLTCGTTNGTASATAEPSGASSGKVVFVSGNWFAAYSADSGRTFHQLDPTQIFPDDEVGFCCDQVVQYAPSIDRFIWLLQGGKSNGNRIAIASPADITRNSGTAWTYWNLTKATFGQANGFDYPDLSLGNNYLYMSWNVGGLQVVRTSLAGLQAGGTISLDYTNPSDSSMAQGAHLSQDTQDEIFWAGHDSNSQPGIRVFSLAEGSGSYFWRDVGIASWANNAPSSTTPDGRNWLYFGFPGHAVDGFTRSSNQLWLAWSAATDTNFKQPHVEMVTLDRSNNFSLVQQVQIWNDSYAFAYPALATNGCTGEVGLSLEYGGNGNYENHVVGFWGDFVVYITTGSNIGPNPSASPRQTFGDYVTIRNFGAASPLFDAFGYGLTTGKVTQTDARYILFGRPSCGARTKLSTQEKPLD